MTETVINDARAHWGLEDAPIILIAARENSVFRVDLPSGPAALRLHRPGYRSAAELRSELTWMAMLAQNGIPVPEPIPALNGSHLMLADGVAIDLLTWLDGEPLCSTKPTANTYYDLGRLMAQMHTCADTWTPPPDFTRPTWDLVGAQPSWDTFWTNPALTQDQCDLFMAFRDTARGDLEALKNPDLGLIHADLIPDNVLYDNGVLRPIDFDDGGFGHRLFDVATVTFRSRRTNPSGALADATIAGYTSERDLDQSALPLFEALRACSYVGWNISRMSEGGAQDRNARFIDAALERVANYLTS